MYTDSIPKLRLRGKFRFSLSNFPLRPQVSPPLTHTRGTVYLLRPISHVERAKDPIYFYLSRYPTPFLKKNNGHPEMGSSLATLPRCIIFASRNPLKHV